VETEKLTQFLRMAMYFKLSFKPKTFPILAFLVPLGVRIIPEILAWPYIIGFDTISYYVPVAWKWVNSGVSFWEFFGYAPLFYLLLYGLASACVSLVALLKILPPILHGILGLSVFFYATKGLDWSSLRGLAVSLLVALYFVGLRISWDMLRSELGLIFFLVFLTFLSAYLRDSDKKLFMGLTLFSVLVVLSHQLVSVIMFFVVFTYILREFLKRNNYLLQRLLLAVLPAAFLFGLIVYADYAVLPTLSESVVANGQMKWFSLLGYSSLADGILNTVGFMLFCYLPLIPFVLAGVKKDGRLELKAWLVWCFIGVTLPFFSPSTPLGYRWTLLMIFPLAFFAVEGLKKLNFGLLKKILFCFAALLSVSFIFLPAESAFPYFRLYPYYVPSSMLQNSVPLSDCADVVVALGWVKANVGSDGVLLVHDAFYGWALLYADGVKILRYGYASPSETALVFSEEGYQNLFLVWWVHGEGWHGMKSLAPSFKEVFRSGKIAIYEFWSTA
jgi:hypothetical protein